jgi:hypothetical protein
VVSSTVVCERLIGHILHSLEVVSLVFLAPPCFPNSSQTYFWVFCIRCSAPAKNNAGFCQKVTGTWWKVVDHSAVDDFDGPNSGEGRLEFFGDTGAPTRKTVY